MPESTEPVASFIVAACVPLDSGHASGTLDRAEEILAAHPAVGTSDIHAAAILGDDTTVRRFLAVDPAKCASGNKVYILTEACKMGGHEDIAITSQEVSSVVAPSG
jgi:hypothetical protein